MRRLILFLLILPLFPLGADGQEKFVFQAETVSYDGKQKKIYGQRARLEFEDKTVLTCGTADFDKALKKGIFCGGIEGPLAVYRGDIPDKNGKRISFEIQGKKIQVERDKSFFHIACDENVSLFYNKRFMASADCASYNASADDGSRGIVQLWSKSGRGSCRVSDDRGDQIQGSRIWIDMAKRQITLEQAKGSICLPNSEKSRVNLSAKKISWNDEEGIIRLNDNVVLECDNFGVICADSADFEYNADRKLLDSLKITIQGNVRMRNQFAEIEGGSPLDQYALADQVVFRTDDREMKLTGKQGKRVLFYDKANCLQISAPALKITAGTKIGRESIKGIGDVRFTFAKQELDLLRKQFPKRI